MPQQLADPPGVFTEVCEALRAAIEPGGAGIKEITAPSRLAPHAFAVSGDILASEHGVREGEDIEELATGRLVLLFDPTSPPEWDGCFRLVSYIRAEMESELGNDSMIGQVAWSWLTDALSESGCRYRNVGGTATRVLSESFGSLAARPNTIDVELRASWTPIIVEPVEAVEQFEAWLQALRTTAGIPPLPEGVTAMPGLRR